MKKGAPKERNRNAGIPLRLDEIPEPDINRIPTGVREFDRVLGGGLVQGSVVLVVGAPGSGKMQPLDAKVLTPRGWVTMGDIKVGMEVVGSGGKPTKVVAVHPHGRLPVYKVRTSDGGETRCGLDHLWTTRTRNDRRQDRSGKAKTTEEIARTVTLERGKRLNHSIPFVGPVFYDNEFAESPLPLEPYALGVYLAEGSFSGSVSISNPEADIVDKFARLLPQEDEIVASGYLGWRVRKKKRGRGGAPPRTAMLLEAMGLQRVTSEKKFIPRQYMMASIRAREMLLQGLLDGDGHVQRDVRGNPKCSTIEYSTSSPRLAEQVRELVLGLGGRVTAAQRQTQFTDKNDERVDGLPSYRLHISFHDERITPVSSKKHLARFKHASRLTERYVESVTYDDDAVCQCITVDAPDGLYVTDDYLVTHNSTLLAQTSLALADGEEEPCKCMYVTGEETAEQSKPRLVRIYPRAQVMIDEASENFKLLAEPDVHKIAQFLDDYDPDVIVIDSIQTMQLSSDATGEAKSGTVNVLIDVTKYLVNLAKSRNVAMLIIGHINKQGEVGGPMTMEHLVDAVLTFGDDDRGSEIRILRPLKNRYGSTSEVGIFRMAEDGLSSVDDPSEHLKRGRKGAPGSSVGCGMIRSGKGAGSRPMLVEVQALFGPAAKNPRRVITPNGAFESGQLLKILNVLETHTEMFSQLKEEIDDVISVTGQDLYINIAGSFTSSESDLDLPVALAIASARLGLPLPIGVVSWGEVDLLGNVRPSGGFVARVATCEAMNFKNMLCSPPDQEMITLEEALAPLYASLEKELEKIKKAEARKRGQRTNRPDSEPTEDT